MRYPWGFTQGGPTDHLLSKSLVFCTSRNSSEKVVPGDPTYENSDGQPIQAGHQNGQVTTGSGHLLGQPLPDAPRLADSHSLPFVAERGQNPGNAHLVMLAPLVGIHLDCVLQDV